MFVCGTYESSFPATEALSYLVSLLNFRNSSGPVFFWGIPSELPLRRLCVNAAAQPTHALTQIRHGHGMRGMHPPHQRMICILSEGWASHSGVHPRGFKICKPATHPLLQNQPAQPRAFSPTESKKAMLDDVDEALCPVGRLPEAPEFLLVLWRGVPESLLWGLCDNVIAFQREGHGLIRTRKRCFHSRWSSPLQRPWFTVSHLH